MDVFICEKCGRAVEYRPGVGFIESGTCPECEPDDYFPPDDTWPYWFHKRNEASIISVSPFVLSF